MKKWMLRALAFLLLTVVSGAQETPVADMAAGYSFFYVVKGYTLATNGGSASVAINAKSLAGSCW